MFRRFTRVRSAAGVGALLAVAVFLGAATIPPAPLLPTTAVYAQDEGDPDTREERQERRQNRDAESAVDEDADVVEEGDAAADPAETADRDCIDFATQEEAQIVLDGDPSDPFNLDPNGDGIACSTLPTQTEIDGGDGAPADGSGDDRQRNRDRRDRGDQAASEQPADCDTLSQEEAQNLLDADPSDPQGLDPDGDGIACETDELAPTEDDGDDRPNRRNRNRDDDPAEVAVPPADLDCVNFTFQEEAQLVLDDEPGDPYNLDPSDDGFACTSLPTRSVTVSAVPSTGTGTGASPAALGAGGALAAAAGFALVARSRSRRTG